MCFCSGFEKDTERVLREHNICIKSEMVTDSIFENTTVSDHDYEEL